MKMRWLMALVLSVFAGHLAAQGTVGTGPEPYATAGNFLDEYYFEVDFGATPVTPNLTLLVTNSAAFYGSVQMYMYDPLADLPSVNEQQDYRWGLNFGNTATATPFAPVTGFAIDVWGPLADPTLIQGSFPVSGVVRFGFTIAVGPASTFPLTLDIGWAIDQGTIVSNAGFPLATGTNLGYHVWTASAGTPTAGSAPGFGRVGDSDYFQRNFVNAATGITRFGNAGDEIAYYIDIDFGVGNASVDVGLYGFVYAQLGTATGSCIYELFDMSAGYSTPVASATVTIGGTLEAYESYTTPSYTGLVRFRLVARGQGLQNLTYGTSFADFGFEVYFSSGDAEVQGVAIEPNAAPPRMAITPGGATPLTASTTLTASGGTPTATYNWSVVGATPAGVTFAFTNPSPTASLQFGGTVAQGAQITIRVQNGATSEFAEETYTINSATQGLAITAPTSLPDGVDGLAYGPVTASASGGTPPYTWSMTGLPGVSINPTTGEITGTPNSDGTFNVTITVTDSDTPPVSVDAQFTVTIQPAGTFIITTSTLPSGTQNQAYTATIDSLGGAGTHTWSVIGVLPGGLSLQPSTGASVQISGTPLVSGTFGPFTIQVTDSSLPTALTTSRQFSITLAPAGGGGPGGPGGFSGGGGGGGGGCASGESNAPWFTLLALLAVAGLATRLRTRKN